jgi:hypothetical protein
METLMAKQTQTDEEYRGLTIFNICRDKRLWYANDGAYASQPGASRESFMEFVHDCLDQDIADGMYADDDPASVDDGLPWKDAETAGK